MNTINGVVGENMPANPTREGYNFLGWNLAPAVNTGAEYINAATMIEPKITTGTNLVVYALWDSKTAFSCEFYDNIGIGGGTLVGTIYTNNGGQTSTLPPTPTRTGYVFKEWNTEIDGSGTAYGVTTAITGKANRKVYAQWTKVSSYILRFDGNDGQSGATVTNMPDQTTIEDGYFGDGPEGMGYSVPIREGYKFIEWNRLPNGLGEAMYPTSIISVSPTTVYAI